jgi:hypothetical protein
MSPVNLFVNIEFTTSFFMGTGIVLELVRLTNFSILFRHEKYSYTTNHARNIVTILEVKVWPSEDMFAFLYGI